MENLVYFENLVRGATTSSREQFGREFVFKKKKKKVGSERKNYSRWVSTRILIHTSTKISFSHRYALVSSRSSMNVSKQTSFKRVLLPAKLRIPTTRDQEATLVQIGGERTLGGLFIFFHLFHKNSFRRKQKRETQHTKQKKKPSAIKTN